MRRSATKPCWTSPPNPRYFRLTVFQTWSCAASSFNTPTRAAAMLPYKSRAEKLILPPTSCSTATPSSGITGRDWRSIIRLLILRSKILRPCTTATADSRATTRNTDCGKTMLSPITTGAGHRARTTPAMSRGFTPGKRTPTISMVSPRNTIRPTAFTGIPTMSASLAAARAPPTRRVRFPREESRFAIPRGFRLPMGSSTTTMVRRFRLAELQEASPSPTG